MSLQTILEGDSSKGNIHVETIEAQGIAAGVLVGAGSVSDGFNNTPTAVLNAVALDVVLPVTLVEGDVYLFFWECRIRSVAGNNATLLDVEFDTAGQGSQIGTSNQLGTTAIGGMQQSGFQTVVIAANGAGANKLVSFDLSGTSVQILNATVAIFQINAII